MDLPDDRPDRRAAIATALGILSMVLATGGCCTCGGSWLLSALSGAVAFMLARASLSLQPPTMSSTSAYARVGTWSGLAGAIFSAGALVISVVSMVGWWLSIYGLANL